jgi:O-Antigen ligase
LTSAAGHMPPVASAQAGEHWSRLDRRLVRPLLWGTVMAGCLVTFEPSPYELMFLFLCWGVFVRGVSFPRFLAPAFLFLTVMFTVGGVSSVLQVAQESDSVRYVVISMYLTITTIVFATLVSEDPLDRLKIIRSAYIVGAVIAATAGIAGYFDIGGTRDLFTLYNRSRGTFKDPNVYGPFLVFPGLLLVQDLLTRHGARLIASALPLGVILIGLLLSFSRAAWGHFIISTLIMAALMFLFSPSRRLRVRMGIGVLGGGMIFAGLIVAILAVPQVGNVFKERADLNQSYDVGETGRFATQARSLPDVIDNPLGLGPLQYSKRYGQDPHNVYLNAFASYGWFGAFGYITFVILTWIVGIRFAFVRTPWQNYHFAALATFLPLSLEGFIIDTDHWRHFYLIAGLLWGMSAAAVHYQPLLSRRQVPPRVKPGYLRAAI